MFGWFMHRDAIFCVKGCKEVNMLWFNFILGSNFISFVSNSLSSNYHNQNKGSKI